MILSVRFLSCEHINFHLHNIVIFLFFYNQTRWFKERVKVGYVESTNNDYNCLKCLQERQLQFVRV